MASTKPTRGVRRLGSPIRAAWSIVLVMMLAAAAWSISGKLIDWGMAPRLAWALSLMFDLAGLICADYARRAIERGTPAGLARLSILGFVVVSGALNWSHGREVGGTVGGLGLASISGAVELLFELHRRDVRDEQRAARGLVAERLPHIPLLGWLLFPSRSWKTLRAAVRVRLETLDTVQPAAAVTVERAEPVPPAAEPAPQLPAAEEQPPALEQPTPTQPAIRYSDPRCAILRPLYDEGFRPTTGEMKTALEDARVAVPGGSTLRGVLRAEIEKHEPELAALPTRPTPLHRAG
ncbi:DUF2637 domain-containing protein [Streptomyces sp. QTS137]